MPDCTIQSHDGCDSAVDFLSGFFFIGFDIASRVGANGHVVDHPAQNRMPAVGDASLQYELHKLFGWRRHILIALAEWHNGKAEALQILRHLYRAPAVKGNFLDVVPHTEFLDEFLDIAVVDNIALGGEHKALPRPYVIRHMIAFDTQVNGFLWQPEERQDFILAVLVAGRRREYQHKGRDVGSAGKIEATIAKASAQAFLIHRKRAGVPLVHGHPTGGAVCPLAQVELPELHFLGRVLLGRFTGCSIVVDLNRLAQRGVDGEPDLGICPVRLGWRRENDRIERRVILTAFQNIHGLRVYLVADGILVGASSGDDEVERLLSGCARAFGHDVEQLPVRLAQQLVEYAAVDVVAVLRSDLRRKGLIDGSGRRINKALLALHDLHSLEQGRALQHHVLRHIEYDGGLLAVIGTTIDFRAFLAVASEQVQRDSCSKLGLTGLLADFNKRRGELAVSVGLDDAEQVADDLLLPIEKQKRFSGPHALGVLERLDEVDGMVGAFLIVMGGRQHKARRLILTSCHDGGLPSDS